MSDHLPKEVREGLELARKRSLAKKSRLRVQADDRLYPVRRLWDGGFSLDAEGAPLLRGLVDLYDGARHLYQCLIIASDDEAGEMIYEFKRHTATTDRPARDFYVDDDAPVALIGRPAV
jgi:hypothetical protein